MIAINVSVDTRRIVAKLNRIQKELGDKVLVSALNKAGAQAKTQMIRGITREFALPASLVRERLRLARAKKAGQMFTATLIGNPWGRSKRAMNVIHFLEKSVSLAEASRRRRGGTLNQLRYKIKRKGSKTTIPGSFIANDGRTVFRRTGPGRLPIEPVRTVGIPQMFNTKRVQQPVVQFIRREFPRIFQREVKYYLSTIK